ncbi:hypothetical protein FNV43_RR23204 [Rhamnella rubrinervis]|uniref:Exocyst component Exo84 C-terminal domain-containing protein n=1 Tax=Rhamnella rubrinervis TaxID=2594499 RepID=A0A8K0DRJ7_9ROSA|nr:hypothetical protein FNV43_RR23204 [Rhamnella rubrinervis]
MESSSASTRFRFRDHSELMENSTQSGTDSDLSSASSDLDDQTEPESMTGRGIKHLCWELLDLKAASNEEFHKTIFSNYSAFVRIFKEAESLQNEVTQLKNHVSTQKRLVKELVDGIHLKFLSDETTDPAIEVSISAEPPSTTDNVSEVLDILISENRIQESLTIIELEEERFQEVQFEDSFPLDELRLYHSEISEKKAVLKLHLTVVAENPRTTAPELQKALVGLCRLGDSNLATQLLLKYYHSRIETGMHNLQGAKTFLHGKYIRELAKLVFSMIAQAAKSFVMLYGETSPYASEIIQWVREESKVFVAHFNQYVKSISEISGGLSTAVQAVQISLSFCSLLECQRLVLFPYLIKHIRPCMEEVLQFHIDHFKKVTGIFTATDYWDLGKYLVSEIVNGGFSRVLGQQSEYCLLTNSGWKFVTLLQTIAEDATPLVALQMGDSILGGFMNLFTEYIAILEKVMICETDVTGKGSSINFALSLQQQISVLANISEVEQLLSCMVRGIFGEINCISSKNVKNFPVDNQQKELDNFMLSIQEGSSRLRMQFCQNFIHRVMSLETSYKFAPEMCRDGQGDHNVFYDVLPSVTFQVFFLELRKLERLAESNDLKKEWLMEILKELIEAALVCISTEKEIWDTNEENLTAEDSLSFKQFVLDMHFIVEIANYGGYFSNNTLILINLMKSALLSAGLDPERDINDDTWLLDSIAEVIQKLLEIEKTTLLPNEEIKGDTEEDEPQKDESLYTVESFQDDTGSFSDHSVGSKDDLVATNVPESATNVETTSLNTKSMDGNPVDTCVINLTEYSMELGNIGFENIATAADDETKTSEKTNLQAALFSVDLVE